MANFPQDCIIPRNAQIADSVKFGPRVILAGDGVVLRGDVRLDAACVIGEGVNVGQGAWVSVVRVFGTHRGLN
jgi:acetyltransferase-like isoleucine patch superfamily enzyme